MVVGLAFYLSLNCARIPYPFVTPQFHGPRKECFASLFLLFPGLLPCRVTVSVCTDPAILLLCCYLLSPVDFPSSSSLHFGHVPPPFLTIHPNRLTTYPIQRATNPPWPPSLSLPYFPLVEVNIRGAIHIDINSWNKSLHAYGMKTWEMRFFSLHDKHMKSPVLRFALAISPHTSQTCTL